MTFPHALKCTIFLISISGIYSESLGPPPGSAGEIDFRYPDVIVNPIPPCPEVGVFPHPFNCTWYYRCYSSFVKGFYYRAYFHCEAGTVFSDGLDQCVAGIGVDGCAGSSPRPPVTTPPTPPGPPPCDDCTDMGDNCQTYTICPVKPDVEVVIQLCTTAIRTCLPCNLSEFVCSGSYYNPETKTCYPSPHSTAIACVISSTPVPVASTTSPAPACTDCYVSTSHCQPTKVCPDNGPEVTMMMCPNAERKCESCDMTTDICQPGEYYSMEESKCYPDPANPSMSCDPPKPPTVDILITSAKKPLQCSVDNRIPQEDWIKQEYCPARAICDGDRFVSISRLCTNYYECTLDEESGRWEAMKVACQEGFLFDFEDEMCKPTPPEEAYCAFWNKRFN